VLGDNQRPQREWPKVRTRTTARPAIGRTGGAIVTLPDRLPLDHALTVGRQAMPGQIVLDHPNVSRRHAAFEVAGGSIVLRDLGGANGTYVNGLRGARSLVSGTASILAHSN
jgi:pSer/pThr/pTyr-binding forkhead associated (FHA) protein